MAPPFDSIDSDDPDVAAQAAQQQTRNHLTQRINSHVQPSRWINEVCQADQRCVEATKALTRLIAQAPKVLQVMRNELRKVFGIDPDRLLFTEPKPPLAPQKVNSLTDRALLILVLPAVPSNLNQFTALSVKDDPARQLPFTPLQVLQQVIAMPLFERLALAATRYWGSLVQGSWRTRKEHWGELQAGLFADRAYLARQLDELSTAGMAMVQALIDAPSVEARQRAGGEWASVHAAHLMWPGTPAIAVPGALHVYREGDPSGAPHVIYLPGVARRFYEYPTFFLLQCGLVQLVTDSLFDELWQCLPLRRRHEVCRPTHQTPASSVVRGAVITGDALALSAQAVLDRQWENELACCLAINHAHVFSTPPRPAPLTAVPFLAFIERARKALVGQARLGGQREHLLRWDAQRRDAEILFANATPDLALLAAQQQVKRYAKGLMALLNLEDPSADTAALEAALALERQLKAHAQALQALTQDAQLRVFELGFWTERAQATQRRVTLFLRAQTAALRCEVQLQHHLKLISSAQRDLVIEALGQPLSAKRTNSQAQALSVSVGSAPDAFYRLHNLWVVTRAAANAQPGRSVPVVLCAFGESGGVLAFSSLDALTQGLKASLKSSDESWLWGRIGRDKRPDLRAHAARDTLAIRYDPIEGNAASSNLKKVLGYYAGLKRGIEDGTPLFSEVKDPQLSRWVLAAELVGQLQAPANRALSQALADLDLLRKAAAEGKKLPAWLARATAVQRRHYKRWLSRYLGSAFAFESRLEQRLDNLETFARRALIARLTQDGFYPGVDIDKPLINMPDDVASHFCANESGCTPGDRKEIQTPSLERTTFSLLQLALHNLDPLAPWTRKRFKHARYLQPDWQHRLNAHYLITTLAALDIGGQYEAKITEVFYPGDHKRDEGRIPALLNRTLNDGARLQLLSAVRQGLSAPAQSLLRTATAARTPQDLLKDGHRLELSVVHLVGHTLQHDRYIAGIVVIHDHNSGRCVVYWPQATHALALTEYDSVQAAHATLNRVAAAPELVKMLARQVAPGWAFEAITHASDATDNSILVDVLVHSTYFKGVWQSIEFVRSFAIKHLEPTPLQDEIEKQIHEQIASDGANWLVIVPTTHSNALALLYQACVLDLRRRTHAACNSGKALAEYRTRRLAEQSETRKRALVSFFVPLYGMVNAVYELLLAARRYHRFGDPRDAVDVGFMSLLLAIELLLSFVPGTKGKGGVAAGVTRRSLAKVMGRIRHQHIALPGRLASTVPLFATHLKVLERFTLKGVPQGAVALKAPGAKGVYVKHGESFVTDGNHHYPVVRRQNEQSYRLKNRLAPGEDELILHIHQPQDWLLLADAPQAGPSSGTHSPWRAARARSPDWQAPVVRTATENRIRQSSTLTTHWMEWHAPLQPGELSSSPAPGIFHVAQASERYPHHVMRVAPERSTLMDPGNRYYRLLPPGEQAPLSGIVFITRNEPLVSLADVDIVRWTSNDALEQPIPVTRTPAGGWQFHAALFDRPLEQYVASAFPTLTNRTREFAVARLIELTGPTRPATATHLLRVRATFDNWLPPAPARPGQTDDLLRMLRPTERGRGTTFISFQGAAPGFSRIDFLPPTRLERRLHHGGRPLRAHRHAAQRAAVRTVLEQQGFTVRDIQVRRYRGTYQESLVTHPNSPTQLYYLSYQWVETGSLRLFSSLSDTWFSAGFKSYSAATLSEVSTALQQQRLVRIVAGIQWPTYGHVSPTVYFIKLSP